VRILSHKEAFRMTSKKGLHVILGAIFSNQITLGAIFAHFFMEFAQIFRNFTRIFRDFVRIFTKSKLLGVRFHPLHPHLLHHWHSVSHRQWIFQTYGSIATNTRMLLFTQYKNMLFTSYQQSLSRCITCQKCLRSIVACDKTPIVTWSEPWKACCHVIDKQ